MEQLRAHGATAAQVAVVLRELVAVMVQPKVGAIRGPWQALDKGTRQGGAWSPELGNNVVAGPLHVAHSEAESRLGPAAPCSAELSRWSLVV